MSLRRPSGGWGLLALALAIALLAATPARAQEEDEDGEGASLHPKVRVGFEAKANFRDSDDNKIAAPFPFSEDMLPPGAKQGFMETVNPGQHFEFSNFSLLLDAEWGPALTAHVKVDVVDLYDRNPTSSDHNVDVDEAWVRFGRETDPATLPERSSAYAKVGKFPKFERQDDRHLESYGLVSTAFNRFEDVGLEVGVDLGRNVYLKASATQGNPVFLRDPNALAGDNGTPESEKVNPDPALHTGITIPYDAEAEDVDLDGKLEIGAGIGVRWGDEGGGNGADLLLWGYQRELAKTVAVNGSSYGGDLDLLRGPFNLFPFPLTSNDKQELGANLWLYLGGFSFFGQYVDQDLGGLDRTGYEAEVAWSFDLPLVAASGGRQLFPAIAPAIRFSRLDPDFTVPKVTPSPSFGWEWDKIDVGVRLTIVSGIDLTAELAMNDFTLSSGAKRSNDELLITLRWRS